MIESTRPILIAEDDKKTSALLSTYLDREGFKSVSAGDGERALDLARQRNPIFAILDIMLPRVDGWQVCSELRRLSAVPILILSAQVRVDDRIKGLALGADDYMSKPFSPKEVVARVKAILRRTTPEAGREKKVLSHRELMLDLEKRKVTLNGQPLSLTRFEYHLLCSLMSSPGRIFLREELLRCLYPDGGVVIDRVIDVHIANLRQKIESDPSRPCHVITARGLGYQFADSAQA